MPFGDLSTPAGIATLNSYLEDKSYIEGYTPSVADLVVYEAIKTKPTLVHALRWYNHITSFASKDFPGTRKDISAYGPAAAPKKDDKPAEDEDDIDLFASDDEDDEENEKLKAQRVAEYNAKKAAKGPRPAAKSMIILDVKPWDDETDMVELEKSVLSIQMDGLVWGAKKLVPVGYGIKKLQISCVVEDDKVGVDDLCEQITAFEDYVQSVDIAAFNKL